MSYSLRETEETTIDISKICLFFKDLSKQIQIKIFFIIFYSFTICRNTHEKLSTIIEIFSLYTNWIQYKFESLTQKQWEFGVLRMTRWTSNFLNIRHNYGNHEVKIATII